MGYTIFSIAGEEGHLGAGLTLPDAFKRVMELAQCEYLFHRVEGVMHFEVCHLSDVPERWLANPEIRRTYRPEYKSTLADDEMARMEIMRMLTRAGFKGFYASADEFYRDQEHKRGWHECRDGHHRPTV